ncbi:MAG: competence protein [Firmicutes bacterium]|nr:competence protein [Bacillota bacterium]
MNYEICQDTLAIIPIENGKSKVIETHGEIIVNKTPMEIIEDSCLYFGSSYDGRHTATKYLLGISYKSPIIIEESRNIIFFPTNSPRQYNCCWISLRNIIDYKRKYNYSIIYFDNGKNIQLNISYGSLDNQILRATRLESIIRNKKIS